MGVWSSDRRIRGILVHLLFKRSKKYGRIRCEGAVLPQTRPQYQRRRTKNELGSATVHRVFVYALSVLCRFAFCALCDLMWRLSKFSDFVIRATFC
jgi:hypothetical protein